ncbi:Abhydrolase domaincontaining protein 13like [Caligus rogercresseyi]|uniref:Abhydrolase domaincontaining protein 13like n=1 Tax=Caligus rogercresseyi TaxID=217165 RepID=A0A7T8KKU9_CALRO|nr:Abhydrolase domaincontaining protein 13like [Caligus rogercresseyi]
MASEPGMFALIVSIIKSSLSILRGPSAIFRTSKDILSFDHCLQNDSDMNTGGNNDTVLLLEEDGDGSVGGSHNGGSSGASASSHHGIHHSAPSTAASSSAPSSGEYELLDMAARIFFNILKSSWPVPLSFIIIAFLLYWFLGGFKAFIIIFLAFTGNKEYRELGTRKEEETLTQKEPSSALRG